MFKNTENVTFEEKVSLGVSLVRGVFLMRGRTGTGFSTQCVGN